jgi:hypothetical protein
MRNKLSWVLFDAAVIHLFAFSGYFFINDAATKTIALDIGIFTVFVMLLGCLIIPFTRR